MQTHTFSIKDALLFPFQMLIKRPLLFFMMLVIAIAIPFIHHNVLIYKIKAFIFTHCEDELAVAHMLTKLFPVFTLLTIIKASIVNCLLTAIAISFYRTGTAPFKTVIASLKYIPLYAILNFIFSELPPLAAYSMIDIVSIPKFATRYSMLIVAVAMTALLSRFMLYPFFLIDKKSGIKSAIASFHATRNNYLKITALAFAFFGVQILTQLLNPKLAAIFSRFFTAQGFNPLTIALMIPVIVIAHIALVYSTCGFAYAYGKLTE